MKPSLAVIACSLLCLLLTSSAFILPARASGAWQGNDDGEFDVASGTCPKISSQGITATSSLTSSMSYTTNGDGWVSIQYNQDWNVDNQCQPAIGGHGGTDWVQAVIVGTSSNNCGGFAFEVINQLWGWDDYLWQYNNALCGQIVNGIFSNGAQWSVAEYTDSNGKIDQVNYYIIGGGSEGGSFFYDYFPPTNWYWYRSQVCWCGADLGEYATFTSGSGWLDYYAGLNFIAWSPPITIGTGEDSNMLYYCFVNIGTTHMYQGFSYSGSHC